MFTKKWVGTANATVAGWGNLGGGISNILMGSILFPLFKNVVYDGDSEMAWRTVCIFPAMLGFITSVLVIKFADDSPRGNFSKRKRTDQMVTSICCMPSRRAL
jgi:NNP family nitrate/nitrite transporter-like MFS transporter